MTGWIIEVTYNGTSEKITTQEFKTIDWSERSDAYMSRLIRNGKRYIDRIIIDVEEMNLDYVQRQHDELMRLNAKHYFLNTGRGYHAYVMTDPIREDRLDHQIYFSFVDLICTLTKVPYDRHMASNPLSKRRIVGSINERTGLKCQFMDISGKVSNTPIIYGDRPIKASALTTNQINFTKQPRTSSHNIKFIPPCVRTCTENMTVNDSSHAERFIVMTYLYEYQEFDQNEVLEFLKRTLPEDRFVHATRTERQHQHSQRYNFPSCKKIKQQGFCTPCKFEQIRTFRKSIGSFT